MLLERGELRTYLEPGEPTRLFDGDVLSIGPGESVRVLARQGGAQGIVFRAKGVWLTHALALAGLDLGSAPMRAATLRAGTRAARHAALCLRDLASSTRELAADVRLARTARALELFGIAISASPGESPDPPRQRRSPAHAVLAHELDTLARDPSCSLTLSRLARRLGLSERQTSRLVHERLGISLGGHLSALRIARAKSLLLESDLAVIDVAEEAGFGSLGHFNHVFRSHTGDTPSAFRRGARRAAAAPVQPPEAGGGGIASDRGRACDARCSPRSSRFRIASTQTERGTLPS